MNPTWSRTMNAVILASTRQVKINIPLYDLKLTNIEVLRTFDDLVIFADIANPQQYNFLNPVQPNDPRHQKLLPVSNSTKRKELV
jgi:hypothetical protein